MISTELGLSLQGLWLIVVSAIAIVATTIAYTRIVGLRTFSKMSSFDFAITVATGSLMASVALQGSSLLAGIVALATLLGVQVVVAVSRHRSGFQRVVDNQPVMLMLDGEYLEDNLRRTRVTRDDVRAKLREANVLGYDEVRAVVLETTGDVSVLHGDRDPDPDLLQGVRR